MAVVGATFAYFTATVTGNNDASSVIVKTAQIGTVTFTDGDEIKLENALPGASTTKSFKIAASNSTIDVKYGIKLNIKQNDFIDTTKKGGSDLVYSLSGNTSGGSTTGQTVNVTDGAITQNSGSIFAGGGTLGVGETHNYTFTIKFKETGSDQNSNQNKTFIGALEVTTGDNASETYYNNDNPSGTNEQPSSGE